MCGYLVARHILGLVSRRLDISHMTVSHIAGPCELGTYLAATAAGLMDYAAVGHMGLREFDIYLVTAVGLRSSP